MGFSLEAARLDLIDAVYAASTDPTRWHVVTDRATRWLGSGSTMFMIPRAETRVTQLVSGNLDPEMMRRHDEYYHAISPWVFRIGAADPLDRVETMVPMEELVRSEYYNEWMAPQDYHFMMGIRPALANGDVLGFAIGRAERHGGFADDERQLLVDLTPHLARAGEIARRFDLLGQQSRATSALLDGLGAGVMLVDAESRLVYANAVAEALLSVGDGLSVRGGRLNAARRRSDALRAAVEAAAKLQAGQRGPGATLSIERERRDFPLTLSVTPFDARDGAPFGQALLACIVISAPELELGIGIDRLRSAYDLTAAEARLVLGLCSGRTLAEYAVAAQISLNTAKYHLKSVFEKFGETRQAELVRRVISNSALRSHS